MCMKKNNNRLLRGVAAVLCLALMFLTMSGMAMATDMEAAPAGVPDTDRNRHRRVVPACRNICLQRVFRLRLRRFRRFRRCGSRPPKGQT